MSENSSRDTLHPGWSCGVVGGGIGLVAIIVGVSIYNPMFLLYLVISFIVTAMLAVVVPFVLLLFAGALAGIIYKVSEWQKVRPPPWVRRFNLCRTGPEAAYSWNFWLGKGEYAPETE